MHLNWIWRSRFIFIPGFILGLASVVVLAGLCFSTPASYRFPYIFSVKPLVYGSGRVSLARPLSESAAVAAPTPAPQAKPKIKLAPVGQRQKQWWPHIRRLARQHNLDPALVMALVQVESSFIPNAVSPKGAQGLMQINPPTAEHLGLEDPLDPRANLEAGTRYLAWLKKLFKNDMVMVLAAYNAGPTKVLELGAVPDHKETRDFVVRVLGGVDGFRQRFQGLARN